jgi:hypothetical protein
MNGTGLSTGFFFFIGACLLITEINSDSKFKPFLTNKGSHFAKDIILCENDNIINNQTEVAETFNNFLISLFSVYFPILFIFTSIVLII